ncbi:MAG TPA: PAS domain S-box protein [Vicinamibacterales bacterium]|jgi:PAS domain S-box-containing protein|nr:PAS domain S-box protein [Vicinamibacterales bacterium]
MGATTLVSATIVTRFRRFSQLGGLMVATIGLLVLVGWYADVPGLTSLHPSWATMKANTAVCFALLGAALLFFDSERNRRATLLLAGLALGMVAVTLSQDVAGWNLHVDELLFPDPASTNRPGRMAPSTAVLLAMIATAILRLDSASRARLSSQWLGLLATIIALMTLCGYAYGAASLYSIPGFGSISIYTTGCVLILGLSVLAAQPAGGLMRVLSADAVGGMLARRLLPVIVAVPIGIGWLRLVGERRGLYDTEFGQALFTVSSIVIIGAVGWFTLRRLILVETGERAVAHALGHSQRLLEAISENSSAVIYAKDLEGRYLYINPRFAELFKLSASAFLGQTDYHLFSKEEADVFRRMDQRVAAAGVALTAEEPVPLDGAVHTYLSVKCPLRDEAGQIYAVFGISTDITDRKRTEEALRANEERTRLIIETALDAVITIDGTGAITGWSPQAERIFGWSRDEVLARSLADTIVPEQYRNAHRHGLAHYMATGEGPVLGTRLELSALHRDGHEFPIELAITPLRTATGVSFSAFVRDITERKRSDERLQAQLERLNLLDTLTRAIGARQDLDSILQVVVRSVEDQLQLDFCCIGLYDRGDDSLVMARVGVRSQPLADRLSMPEKARVPVGQNGLRRCVNGQLVYEPDLTRLQFFFPQRLANGGLRSLVAAPLLVESTTFGVLMAARRSGSAFSSAECEFLRQLSEHVALAAQQAQLYAALQHAYDDLKQTQQAVAEQERLRVLGQMASGIAHDINNAISPIALCTDLLMEAEPALSAESQQHLSDMRHAVDDVAHTVDRLREFYRDRESQPQLAPVDLNSLAKEVVSLTRAKWSDMPQRQGVVIGVSTQLTETPRVSGAESDLRQALINLVFNAVDAMPEGGTLTIRTRMVPPTSDAPLAAERVAIEVSDTGVGMNDETRQRCLEPFFSTKGRRGTGLGLATVYGTAQRHSADLEIESEPGRGTTVRLAFLAPSTPLEVVSARKPLTRVPPMRILIIDDDPVLLRSLHDALKADGHTVTASDGGQNGIDAFRREMEGGNPFAVVITDLGMPSVDGRKVASAIKAISPSTPLVMLTGWGQRMIDEGDLPSYVDRVLAKPPRLSDLRLALAELTSEPTP